jgi:hypothetical protein
MVALLWHIQFSEYRTGKKVKDASGILHPYSGFRKRKTPIKEIGVLVSAYLQFDSAI